jgi:hypothetical protein
VLPGQLAELAEVRAGRLGVFCERRHRHEPANVDSQRPGFLQERAKLLPRHPGFRPLSGQVDFDQRGGCQALGRRKRVEGVNEFAERGHVAPLPRLQVPDEVPPEALAEARMLGLEVLETVFPHHGDAGLRERLHLLQGDVLRSHDYGDVLAHLILYPRVIGADLVSGYRQ